MVDLIIRVGYIIGSSCLTLLGPETCFGDICKQCRPSPDAAECQGCHGQGKVSGK